jgi:uncharacterized protein with PIN domain
VSEDLRNRQANVGIVGGRRHVRSLREHQGRANLEHRVCGHVEEELRLTARRRIEIVGSASVRFYGSLNDFLPAGRRQSTLVCAFDGSPSVKDLVEALGVPHPEIDVLIVDGQSVDFRYRLGDGDRVAAYPLIRAFDLGDTVRLHAPAQTEPRFIADVHLGRLAAFLRLSGFDTQYRNDYPDDEIVAISASEDRVLLTRDIGVLKHGVVRRGYFPRETQPVRQLVEVLRHFDLVTRAAPFTRCLRCNSRLQAVAKDRVRHLLPARTRECYREFSRCPTCSRVYWQGSHYSRMRLLVDTAFAAAASADLR